MEATLYTTVYTLAAITLAWLVWEFVGGAIELWDECAEEEPKEDLDDMYQSLVSGMLLDKVLPVSPEANLWEEPTKEEEDSMVEIYRKHLKSLNRELLRDVCRGEGIKNYGVMTKEQMVEALMEDFKTQ